MITKEEREGLRQKYDDPDHDVIVILDALEAAEARVERAERTLKGIGYTDEGGELWKPPLGKKPNVDLVKSFAEKAEKNWRLRRQAEEQAEQFMKQLRATEYLAEQQKAEFQATIQKMLWAAKQEKKLAEVTPEEEELDLLDIALSRKDRAERAEAERDVLAKYLADIECVPRCRDCAEDNVSCEEFIDSLRDKIPIAVRCWRGYARKQAQKRG